MKPSRKARTRTPLRLDPVADAIDIEHDVLA